MKKVTTLIALAVVIFTSAFAYPPNGSEVGNRGKKAHIEHMKNLTPEERAQKMVDRMDEHLVLTDAQETEVYQIALKKQQEIRTIKTKYQPTLDQMKAELKEVREKYSASKEEAKENAKAVREKYKSGLEPMRNEIKSVKEATKGELKGILTTEQIEKLKQHRANKGGKGHWKNHPHGGKF